MSDLLKTMRAMDDQNFKWRVQAAMVVTAQAKLTGGEPDHLVSHVLANPQGEDRRMLSIVASCADVRAGITVDFDGFVDTSGVTDEAIQACVDTNWDTVAGLS